MPPRSGKRRVAGPGSRRAVRGRGMAAKLAAHTHVETLIEESTPKGEEVTQVETKIEESAPKAEEVTLVETQIEESTTKAEEVVGATEAVRIDEGIKADEVEDQLVEDKDVETVENIQVEETTVGKDIECGVKIEKEDETLEDKEVETMEVMEQEDAEVDAKKEEVLEERNVATVEKVEEQKLEENEDDLIKSRDYAKECKDEYEKDEKLDLEDNDPDYEPEDYGCVYYDEREMEQDHHEGRKIDEDTDEVLEDEDVGNGVQQTDVYDEVEHEEDEEQVRVEHDEMVDAVEDEDHKEMFKERRKRKEFEIFVGGLDKDATESDLRKVFSEVGEVTEVRLMMNPQTKKNKGFAFLRFATVEQAKRACVQLKNPLVHGKQCGVTPSQDSDTLFLGNVCRAWTKEALKEKLGRYGVENVEDLTVVEDSNNTGTNRGFAFLEFSSRADAMDAFKRLQKRDVFLGVDRPAKVSFADSFIDPGDEIMAQVKTVFVDGLSTFWDVEHVKELLKKFGKIEKVELSRDMPTARRKDFGFVTFDTHDAAVLCAKSINNEDLGEGDKKAKVRARLSRPLQRAKGKHVVRGDFRPGRGSLRGGKSSWDHTITRASSLHGSRGSRQRHPLPVNRGFNRPANIHESRAVMPVPPRSRPAASLPRPYERRPPVLPPYKGDLKRDFGHREELLSRSRPTVDFSFRDASERHLPYRDDFPHRASGYPGIPTGGASRSVARRSYSDDAYSQRYERPPPSYREDRPREYGPMPGSKRPYAAMVDVPPRYSEAGMRHSRARLDYDLGSSASRYSDTYGDRFGRSSIGYGGSRSSISSQDSHGLYNSHQGMGYRGGPYGGNDNVGMYSSSFSGDYVSRGMDVGGSSYSSVYPGRSLGGNGYMGSNSGSYY